LDTANSIKFNNTASATVAGVYPAGTGPVGGNGLSNNAPFATGGLVYYAGGGSGGGSGANNGQGGGNTANRGGGGYGSDGANNNGITGGSGVVVIRYRTSL
jgi:hypothetical protein